MRLTIFLQTELRALQFFDENVVLIPGKRRAPSESKPNFTLTKPFLCINVWREREGRR